MVRTLAHAFESGRIAHAFLLAGIRGVGKTTTARILARGLNCTGAGRPTTEPCGRCESCRAISEERSLDVIETDAASHTGKDEIREIIDGVQYAPAVSRFKVYIFDEVHMLSEKAWNALLKTVEEPPPHVKFIFATTEIRKVPVTVLSRCQRFDLRRVDIDLLSRHLAEICRRESIDAQPEALAHLARAAEGSVRDALSLLDQAVATSEGRIRAREVEAMLGLADRSRLLELFEQIVEGRSREAVERFGELYMRGADPAAVIGDLLELCHLLTRMKLGETQHTGLLSVDAEHVRRLAGRCSHPELQRLWQMILRGLEEVRLAPDPWAAAEMLLVRLTCVSDLPPPAELARLLRAGEAPSSPASTSPPGGRERMPQPTGSDRPIRDFAEAVELLRAHGEPLLAAELHESAHVIRFEPGRIVLRLESSISGDLPNRLAAALRRLTGRNWIVALGREAGAPTLREQRQAWRQHQLEEAGRQPLVRTALEIFPGARLVDVREAAPGPSVSTEEEARKS